MKDTLLIIPAYNEDMNIEQTIRGLMERSVPEKMDILIINDGSSDRTLEKAKSFEPTVKVIDQVFNMGYGAALQTGYKYAVSHGYDYLLQMDSDGQHDPENLNKIIDRLKGRAERSGLPPKEKAQVPEDRLPDIVIGSRFLEGSQTFQVSGLKKIAIALFNAVIRVLTGYCLTDPTSGLQGLNRSAFTYYAGFQNFDIRYPDLNMIVQMIFLGYHVEEIPAIMHERMAGTSMHAGIIQPIKYMFVMFVSTFNTFTRHYRLFGKRKESKEA